jgi:hypothetical protein
VTLHIDRSLRLPEAEYFPGAERKSGIAIHHTVGGSAQSTFEWWLADRTNGGRPELTATAYIVARDGTIHEVFDPSAWAYQFGLTWPVAARLRFERRFVGVELASAGGLIERAGQQRRSRPPGKKRLGLVASLTVGTVPHPLLRPVSLNLQ